jgi:hypothetical protein
VWLWADRPIARVKIFGVMCGVVVVVWFWGFIPLFLLLNI